MVITFLILLAVYKNLFDKTPRWIKERKGNGPAKVGLINFLYEDFYNFVEFLCPPSITSGITVAETLLMIFPQE